MGFKWNMDLNREQGKATLKNIYTLLYDPGISGKTVEVVRWSLASSILRLLLLKATNPILPFQRNVSINLQTYIMFEDNLHF